MALQKQLVQAPLGLGVDTKTDPKQVASSGLLELENGVIKQTGEIRKRYGVAKLSSDILQSDSTISSSSKLETYNNELLLFNQDNVFSYAESLNAWANKGLLSTIDGSTSPIVANSYEQTGGDIASTNGITLYAWEDSRGGVRYSVIDQASGAALVYDAQVNINGMRPRCVAVGTYFFLFCYQTFTNNLEVYRISTTNPSLGVSATAAGDISTTEPIYDVTVFGSRMLLAYKNTSNKLKFTYWLQTNITGNPAYGVPSALEITAETPSQCLTIIQGEDFGSTPTFSILFFNSSTGLRHLAYYADFTEYKSAIVVDNTVSPIVRNVTAVAHGEKIEYFAEYEAASAINRYIKRGEVYLAPNSVANVAEFQRAGGLVSKAYRVNDATKVHVSYESPANFLNTLFVLGTAEDRSGALGWGYNWGYDWGGISLFAVVESKLLTGVHGGHNLDGAGGLDGSSPLPGVWFTNTNEAISCTSRRTRIVADNISTYTLRGLDKIEIDYNAARVGPSAQLGDNLHIPGGFLRAYDGVSVVEHGFHMFPDAIQVANSVTAGSVANGTYQYVAVYEWIDGKGQLHRSAPSIPVSHTVSGGPKGVDITVPTLRYTAKQSPERTAPIVAVYRTTNAGTLYYKVSDDTDPLYNLVNADTVTFVDTLADALITSKPLLYTTGGTLENISVSACNIVASFDNRLFIAGLEQPNDLMFSKQWVVDEGVAFNDFLRINVSPTGGEITSIFPMDDKLIIFKQNAIYYLSGEGPTDVGQQNLYRIQQIASDVGCSVPESVCLMPLGLMFKSLKGVYLLDRALNAVYIGSQVEAYNGLSITGGNLVPTQNQVRFTSSEGRTLVFDYYFKQWFTFTGQSSSSSIAWKNQFTYSASDGSVFSEEDGRYDDNGSVISTKITTGWLSFAGLQGYKRVYLAQLFGELKGSHTLSVKLSYDFKNSYSEEFTAVLDTGAAYGDGLYGDIGVYGGTEGTMHYEVQPAKQKCTSIKVTIQDYFPDSRPSEGFRISGLSFEVGIEPGLKRLNGNRGMTSLG